MLSKGFIEETGNWRLKHKERLLHAEFARRAIPGTFYTTKRSPRRQFPFSTDPFTARDVDAMHGAVPNAINQPQAPKRHLQNAAQNHPPRLVACDDSHLGGQILQFDDPVSRIEPVR